LPFQFLRTERRAWVALVVLFVVSLPAVTARIYASDEAEYFSYLRSIWFDRDVSFENEYRHFYDHGLSRAAGFHETFLERRSATGLRENFGTIGCAILWSPFYAVGDATARALRAAGHPVEADGYSWPYVAAVCYGSAVYGFLALVLAAVSARRVVGGALGRPGAAAVVLTTWLGTPLVFYMYVAPPYSHACSAFAVALFVYAWLRVRPRWSARGLALLGALAALMTMVREQDAFVAVGVALDFLWGLVAESPAGAATPSRAGDPAAAPIRSRARLLAHAALGVAAFAAAFAPQAAAYLALNGRVGPSPLVARKMIWSAPHALQVLFSPEHGLFVWTPLALLAVAGLVALAVRGGDDRRLGLCLIAMVAAEIYVAGSVDSWMAAGAFGQRRFVGLTTVLLVGLAALAAAARATRWRYGLAAAFVLGTWWNVALMIQFGTGLMDRQRLEPGRNAYEAFVGVPARVPELTWRYLFDRASFYQRSTAPDR
jgi:hypothetical protein